MNILGLHMPFNHLNHDPGAALLRDGEIIVVCEEERLNRIKTARGYLPVRSIWACLKEAKLKMADIDLIVSTGVTRQEELSQHIKLFLKHYFDADNIPLQFVHHQMAHAASAFFYSGLDKAMCLSYDGEGDGLSGILAVGSPDGLKVVEEIPVSLSLGNFYSSVTGFLGFRRTQDEYKVMGLASYGKEGVDLSAMARPSNGHYVMDESFWNQSFPLKSIDEPLYNQKFIDLLGKPRRQFDPITQRHKDVAYAAQKTLEQCVVSLIKGFHKKTGLDSLCMAGGVALNCSANRIIRKLPFIKRIFIQPAASDRGLPLGGALFAAYQNGIPVKIPSNVFMGPSYTNDDILKTLKLTGADYVELPNPADKAAELLADGKIIGWFQGRSEFGPRALGNRSILADPRPARMKDEINARIKFREEFRPFAPAVLEEKAGELFEMQEPSPYMTVTYDVKPAWQDKIKAVTHVDKTARVQTVNKNAHQSFHELISLFERKTGVPAVLNTSFNARSEPIVESPWDALSTFWSVGMDALFLGPFMIQKSRSPRQV